jgi:hypothetical protein
VTAHALDRLRRRELLEVHGEALDDGVADRHGADGLDAKLG